MLWLRGKDSLQALGSLTELGRIVSLTRPLGLVDLEEILDKNSYE